MTDTEPLFRISLYERKYDGDSKDLNGNPRQDRTYIYYIDGKEVSQQEYEERIREWLNAQKIQ